MTSLLVLAAWATIPTGLLFLLERAITKTAADCEDQWGHQ